MGKRIELKDEQFGRITVIEYAYTKKRYKIYWKCFCDPKLGGCGKIFFTRGENLTNGDTQSCGCLQREVASNLCNNWKGGRYITKDGYVSVCLGHRKRRFEHLIIVEKVLDRSLKKGEIVHHINGNKSDNRNCNLLVCSRSYHMWLHTRMSQLYMKEKFK